eukprot:11352230-Alexandrium_andersonii.AAC.1
MRTWRMTSTWRPHPSLHSQARAPSCAGAATALGRPLPGGRRCVPPSWRASGSSAGKPARAASTTPSWMPGASCAGTTLLSPGTTWTWTSSRTS